MQYKVCKHAYNANSLVNVAELKQKKNNTEEFSLKRNFSGKRSEKYINMFSEWSGTAESIRNRNAGLPGQALYTLL